MIKGDCSNICLIRRENWGPWQKKLGQNVKLKLNKYASFFELINSHYVVFIVFFSLQVIRSNTKWVIFYKTIFFNILMIFPPCLTEEKATLCALVKNNTLNKTKYILKHNNAFKNMNV